MAMPILCQIVMFLAGSPPAPPLPAEKPAGDNVNRDYVRLTAAIRGTLEVEKDRILVVVNQGGGCMTAYNDYWVLDFGKDEALKASAAELKGKAVVLTGEPERPIALPHVGGVGAKGSAPPRLVIHVKTIAAAPAK